MRRAIGLGWLVLVSVAFWTGARAEVMQATRAGIMCTSADALAKLSIMHVTTMPPSGAPLPRAADVIATAGGCTGFPQGFVVIVSSKRVNTSIVRADTLTGDGLLGTEIVANVDFAPYSAPHTPFYDTVRARCPARIETMLALGPPSHAFVDSLPPALRSSIEKSVDDECSERIPCILVQRPEEVIKRHLERPWADFVCSHPE